MRLTRILACSLGIAVAPAAASELTLDEIAWPNIDSYCTFMRADHVFTFDDPRTWRFVFFSNMPALGKRDPIETPFVRIDGQLTQLTQTDMETTGFETTRRYVAKTDPEVAVEVFFRETGRGGESTGYTGTITASRDGQTATVDFTGDCGV